MTDDDPLFAVADVLRCPNCGGALDICRGGASCAAGHRFDRARQGYLTLFGPAGRRFPGDTADQVGARERVLSAGVLDGVSAAVAGFVAGGLSGGAPVRDGHAASGRVPLVVDVGSGPGHHLAAVLDRVLRDPGTPGVRAIGTEISAAAARRLARAHPRAAALVADTWQPLPLGDEVADVVTVVFAPRNSGEFARVLRQGGTLVVAAPEDGHLEPLRTAAGMLDVAGGKADRLAAELSGAFEAVGDVVVDDRIVVPASTAVDLALMGPSGVHLDRRALAERLGAGVHEVRVHVGVHAWRRRP